MESIKSDVRVTTLVHPLLGDLGDGQPKSLKNLDGKRAVATWTFWSTGKRGCTAHRIEKIGRRARI
jgi:hypothetical protein